MDKHIVLRDISCHLSFITSFFDEYRAEFEYDNEHCLIDFLSEVKSCIEKDLIPNPLIEKIFRIFYDLNIKRLIDLYEEKGRIHQWDIYNDTCNRIIVSGVFASKTFNLYKAIGFTNSNVVLIGANGCGKTSFANSIREELEKTNNGIVIPAQKLLIFPTYSSIPLSNTAYKDFEQRQKSYLDDKQTYTAAKNDDHPYSLAKEYSEELRILVSALIAERLERRDAYCSTIKDGDTVHVKEFISTIDEVINIWNFLIEHRTLECGNTCTLSIRYNDKTYPAYRMSDGERDIFYVVGRVLLAKESSLIIIDEPELHLHKAILNKLWDILEERRKDCMFIYLTHDVEFAASRIAQKCWLKSYSCHPFDSWDVEPIIDSEIPESLLYKILGSRKQILFCEGKKGSLDKQIFETIFPSYTIIPLSSCKAVISYTRAFNKIPNVYASAIGIIDRDFRTEEQIQQLQSDAIYTYEVSEIENLFMIPDFLEGFAEYKHEPFDFDEIKSLVIERFANDKEIQTSLFVTQKINFYIKEGLHIKNGKNKDEVTTLFDKFVSQIKTEEWFAERLSKLEELIASQDYNEIIKVYNNKGLHSIVEKTLKISSYNHKALQYLKSEDKPKEILRSYFPIPS